MPAWTAPRDWTTAEVVTEAMMDTHVKDNFNSLHQMTILRRTTAVTGTAAFVVITWEAEDLDEPNMWAGGAPTRLTAAVTGRFEIHVYTNMTTATGTGEVALKVLRYNSAGVLQETWCENWSTKLNQGLSVYGIGQMTATDYLEIQQFASATGTAPLSTFRAVLVQRG